jgi:recombination protein RecT
MTATTVSSAVATRDEQVGPIKFMWSKRAHFNAVLPASVDVEAFLGTAAGALYASDVPGKNLTLMKCAQANPDSLFVALMECAALGHRPGTDEYYLTPRMDHGRPKVLGIEGYKGVVERFYRSGAVANVIVREVCADDPFAYVEGVDDIPRHETGGRGSTGADFFGADGDRRRGRMVGVYAYAKLLTGAYSRVVLLRRKDVLAARDSGGYKADDKFTPWNRMDAGPDEPELQGRSMWWKTAAKRLEPWVPTSAEYRREQLRASAAAVSSGPRPAAELPPPPDGIVDAVIVDEPQPDAAQLEQPQERRPRGPRRVDTGTGEVTPPEGDPRGDVIARLAALGADTTAAQLAMIGRLTGKQVTTVDALTGPQAAWVAQKLAGLSSRDELEAAATAAETRRADGEAPAAEARDA